MTEKVDASVRPSELDQEVDSRGFFHRQKNHFTKPFSGTDSNPVEAGRYRLVWAKGCQWSNRSSIVIELLGLDKAISTTIAGRNKHEKDYGWEFVNGKNSIDEVFGVQFLSELYANADPEYKGRPTVPALVDIKTKKVVNNDYHWLTNHFEKDFKELHAKNAPDLYPEELQTEIDEFNIWLFDHVNNAPYRAQFGQSIEAYNEAINTFYRSLDNLEERLENQRFLFGDYVTDADVRFFVTLARFDTRYYRNLGPLPKRIIDYKNIWAYARDLYTIPAFKHNTYFHDIAKKEKVNDSNFQDFATRFWQDFDYEGLWSEPQNRRALSKTPEQKFKLEKD